MKGKIVYLFIFIIIAVLALAGVLNIREKENSVQAALTDNVTGWAWIEADDTANPANNNTGNPNAHTIGWVSFNDTNVSCNFGSYGVNVDYTAANNDDKIRGKAWVGIGADSNNGDCNDTENTVGYIDFDDNSHPCGTAGYPTNIAANYNFPARLVAIGGGAYEIQGWAPIKTKNQAGVVTILTWINFKKLNPIGYSVKINSNGTIGSGAAASDHYAWAGDPSDSTADVYKGAGLGWINMASTNGGVIFPPTANCPNNIREGTEVCDGADLAGQTCITRGYDGGSLSCLANCSGFNESNCTDCGNGTREGAEFCDGTDGCAPPSNCIGCLVCNAPVAVCGDALISAPEVCDIGLDGVSGGGDDIGCNVGEECQLGCNSCAASGGGDWSWWEDIPW